MADIGGSVEDYIVKKLKLNELLKADQVKVVLDYFKSIINGDIKTTPPELKGLLQLMINMLQADTTALITEYLIKNEDPVRQFFVKNFQRFNYYEFKHQLMVLKGELASQEFKPPVNDRRNFEMIEPLDVTPYAEILESNPQDLAAKRKNTQKTGPEILRQKKNKEDQTFDERIIAFKKMIKQNINQGNLDREVLVKKLSEVEEMCIPAIQLRYNTQAIETLNNIILGDSEVGTSPSSIFEELKMSIVSRELFYRLLVKKIK